MRKLVFAALLLYAVPAAAGTASLCFPASTLFDAPPAVAVDSDPGSVELGTKFTPAINGCIYGVRFYRGEAGGGPFVVTLWSQSGQQLARTTVNSATTPGWQEARFEAGVTLTAGTMYTVSYHAPAGRYAAKTGAFSAPITAGPLTAPVNAGVYKYSQTPAFPTQTYQASSYGVDVLFIGDEK